MTKFHAVMVDETGCEFGASVEAHSKNQAYQKLRASYPESRCMQLESPHDTNMRERRMYRQIRLEFELD